MSESEMKYCSNCGKQIDIKAEICPECGVGQESPSSDSDVDRTTESDVDRTTAAIFALLLGGLGVHKFYMSKTKLGIIYLCFSWTFIPAIVGFIEGIIYLTKSDEEFQQKYIE